MKTGIYLVACLLVLAIAAPAISAPAEKATDDGLYEALEAILREAQRQERVSGEMSRLIKDFKSLVGDLKSNRLLSEAKGDKLIAMAGDIGAADEEHVRVAAKRLRDAGSDFSGRKPHIEAASTEIRHALDKLTVLLRDANALQAEETDSRRARAHHYTAEASYKNQHQARQAASYRQRGAEP